MNKRNRIHIKRAVEALVAVGILLFSAPLLAIIAIMIKVTSKGPVLVRHRYSVRNSAPFAILRFRTVSSESELAGVFGRPRPRITSIGRFLQMTSCDELPQLWNVVRGDMTLVGPSVLTSMRYKKELPDTAARKITTPPGSFLQSVATFLFSRRTVEQAVKPIIADLQFEYFEALSQQEPWKARWIRIRYFCSLCIVLGLLRILKLFASVWRQLN